MNEPIISPWLVYWVTRIEYVQAYLLTAFLIICISGPLVIIYCAAFDTYDDIKDKYFNRWAKTAVIGLLICGIFDIFVPSKEVIIAMYVAKQVTPANIQTAGAVADKSIDYIGIKADKTTDAAVEKIIRIIDAIKKEDNKK